MFIGLHQPPTLCEHMYDVLTLSTNVDVHIYIRLHEQIEISYKIFIALSALNVNLQH